MCPRPGLRHWGAVPPSSSCPPRALARPESRKTSVRPSGCPAGWEKGGEVTESRPRDRVLVAALAALVAAAVVLLRLVALQIVAHGTFIARAEQNQEGRVLLPPRRGDLLDRRGELLATDLRTYSVYAVPRLMKDRRRTA